MVRRNHSESDIEEGGGGYAANSGFFLTSSILPPNSHVIQGLYKPGAHMLQVLSRIATRINLPWLAWDTPTSKTTPTCRREGDGKRRMARHRPISPPRPRPITLPTEQRSHNPRPNLKPSPTEFCNTCSFWDKVGNIGCLLKRVNGEGFICPYANGQLNVSFRQRPNGVNGSEFRTAARVGVFRPSVPRVSQPMAATNR